MQAADAGLARIRRVGLTQDSNVIIAMDTVDPNAATQRAAEQVAQQQTLQQPVQESPSRAAKMS